MVMVKIPKFLYEIHGKESSRFDLFITYFGALVVTVLVVVFAWPTALSAIKKIVLVLLLLDIAGGVVANLTPGTKAFYANNPLKRKIFIGLHVLQPLLLVWIFPEQTILIGLISGLVLLMTFVINQFEDLKKQRVISATSLMGVILLTMLFESGNRLVEFILVLYAIKLMFSFAVRWNQAI